MDAVIVIQLLRPFLLLLEYQATEWHFSVFVLFYTYKFRVNKGSGRLGIYARTESQNKKKTWRTRQNQAFLNEIRILIELPKGETHSKNPPSDG